MPLQKKAPHPLLHEKPVFQDQHGRYKGTLQQDAHLAFLLCAENPSFESGTGYVERLFKIDP